MINVIYLDMPGRIKGFVHKNSDLSHTIVINAKLNLEQQKEIYQHEIEHIERNDFDKDDIDLIEYLMLLKKIIC